MYRYFEFESWDRITSIVKYSNIVIMKLQIIHIGELKTNLIKNIRIDCIFIFTDVYDWYYTDHLIGLRNMQLGASREQHV